MSEYWPLLIPVAAVLLFGFGAVGVLRLQKRGLRVQSELSSGAAPRAVASAVASAGLEQAPHESREEFVRRHWQRSGVVANGETLVDLYDRIRALEERVARAEQPPAVPPVD